MKARVLVCAVGLATAGCADVERYWNWTPSVFAAGADTRFVSQTTASPASRTGQIHPYRLSCAEPSPDVATAVSRALTATIEATRGTTRLEAGAALVISESIAELGERTATIQLLRDTLFRACEAYANGAITDVHYAMIMARYDALSATLMSAEWAGRSSGPGRATIQGAASAGSGAGSADTVAELQAAAQELQAAAEAVRLAEEAVLSKRRQLANTTAEGQRAPLEAELATLEGRETVARTRLRAAEALFTARTAGASLAGAVTLAAVEGARSGEGASDGARRASYVRDVHENFLRQISQDRGPIFTACVALLSRSENSAAAPTSGPIPLGAGHATMAPDGTLRSFCWNWMTRTTDEGARFRELRENNLQSIRASVIRELEQARQGCRTGAEGSAREASCAAYAALARALGY